MSAINHGTEVSKGSRREVLMGYQYALHQHKKKLREERDIFVRSRDNNSMSRKEYWDDYSDDSEYSRERRGDCYVSNVSIIFDAPCLFLHHLPNVSLHFVALLCIFQN
jgi:hypothetical protein